jgi:hypothetical protein
VPRIREQRLDATKAWHNNDKRRRFPEAALIVHIRSHGHVAGAIVWQRYVIDAFDCASALRVAVKRMTS